MAKEADVYITLTADEYASLMNGDEVNKTIKIDVNKCVEFANDEIELRVVLDRRASDAEVQGAFEERSMRLELGKVYDFD